MIRTISRRSGIYGARLAAVLAFSLCAALAASVPAGASTNSGASKSSIVVVNNQTWGPILETGSGKAVYLFAKDTHDHSACAGACAKAWPPVLVPRGTTPVGKGVSGLGTIARSGGQDQVTYDSLPLYTFVGDKQAGHVNGNITDKFGKWWAVNPAHPKTPPTRSSGSSGSTGSSAANGY